MLATVVVFSQQPYVLLISFDGFRWDYINKGLTPTLQKFAREGVSASSLEPCFPSKTFPNHIAIITGCYPQNHGITGNSIYDPVRDEQYSIWDTISVREPRWYQGEAFWETAERQGVKTASFFWPGSEIKSEYRTPTYYKLYNHNTSYEDRIAGIVNWLSLPYEKRPHFLTLYFEATDDYGHKYGPDGNEIDTALIKLENTLQKLFAGIKSTPVGDSLNIVIVSDHGMTGISQDRIIEVKSLLEGFKYDMKDNGPVSGITPAPDQEEAIYNELKKKENHYRVYKRADVPEHFHFSSSVYIQPIVLIADMGWMIVKENKKDNKNKGYSKGMHGYDNYEMDMHGIFFANGPAFRKNYRTGTLKNIDINPLLCKVFSIFPRPNIDGKLDRISFILK